MDLNHLNFLPNWEDDKFNFEEEGEEWKTAQSKILAKQLYLKLREVFGLVVAFAENLCDDEETENKSHAVSIKNLIYENALIVAPKIISASYCNLYMLQMENAAIIRSNCRQLMEQIRLAAFMEMGDTEHTVVIGEAMNEFRELFKDWVAGFTKDDCKDEWGLFE